MLSEVSVKGAYKRLNVLREESFSLSAQAQLHRASGIWIEGLILRRNQFSALGGELQEDWTENAYYLIQEAANTFNRYIKAYRAIAHGEGHSVQKG